jgi:hypothetical protein
MTARGRYFVLALSRIVTAAGAVFGVVLAARAPTLGPKLLGLAIVVMALVVMAIVPRHLARRWRSPR